MNDADLPPRTEVTGGVVGAIGSYARVEQHFYHPAGPQPIVFPVHWGRPPLLADSYQERPDLLNAVLAAFDAGDTAVLTQTQVITGDGGVGKSQLANRTWEHLTTQVSETGRAALNVAIWVTAASRAAIQSAYAAAAERLALGDAANPDGAALALLDWMATTDNSWLLILDDVNDPADLNGLWPQVRRPAGPGSAAGRVLVTTRRRDRTLFGHGRHRIDVGIFTRAESISYLTRRLAPLLDDGWDQAQALDGLASDVGDLPIALAQASACILNSEDIDVAEYRHRWADRSRTLAELTPADPGDEHASTMATTWSLAMDRADAMAPAGAARRLGEIIAFLDPNGIPEAVLTSTPARAYTRVPDLSIDDARQALGNLSRCSIVMRDLAAAGGTVRMHALAQRATRESLPIANPSPVIAAAHALLAAWPEIESDPLTVQALRAGIERLYQWAGDELWRPSVHPVLWRAGRSLGESGLLDEAMDHWESMAQVSERLLGADHADTILAKVNRADLRGQAGDAAGAANAFTDLLPDSVRLLGADHPETLAVRHNLAYWNAEAGDTSAAAAIYAELLPDRTRVLGVDHPDTLVTQTNLAHVSGRTGDADAMLALYDRLLNDMLRILGPNHPNTLVARSNQADWLGQAGDAASAADAYADLLTDYLRVLGPEHPDTLIARASWADWQGRAGHPSEAAQAYVALLEDYLRVLGPSHPNTLSTRANLADWEGRAGQPAKAARDLANLLPDAADILGREHPFCLTTQVNLTHWRRQANKHGSTSDQAPARRPHGSCHSGPSTPEEHPEKYLTASSDKTPRKHAASGKHAAGGPFTRKDAESEPFDRLTVRWGELLRKGLDLLGESRPESMAALATPEPGSGRTLIDSARALSGQLRQLDLQNYELFTLRTQLAHWLRDAGDSAGAGNVLADLLTDVVAAYGADRSETLQVRGDLARCHEQAEDWAGAAAAYSDLLSETLRLHGSKKYEMLGIRSALARTHELAGDAHGAATAYTELYLHYVRLFGKSEPETLAAQNKMQHWNNQISDRSVGPDLSS